MDRGFAVAFAEGGADAEGLIFDLGEDCDGGMAIAIQFGDNGAFSLDRDAGEAIVELREDFQGCFI